MPNSITPASVEAEFLSRKQAGQFLNISEAWIRKMERAGTGPERIRFGKCVRYSRTPWSHLRRRVRFAGNLRADRQLVQFRQY